MSPTNRTDQIRFLQGLRDGTRSLDELSTDNGVVFAYSTEDPELWECGGKLYTKNDLKRRDSVVLFIESSDPEDKEAIESLSRIGCPDDSA